MSDSSIDAPSTPQGVLSSTPDTSQVVRNLSTSFTANTSTLAQSAARVYQSSLPRSSTPKSQNVMHTQQTASVTSLSAQQHHLHSYNTNPKTVRHETLSWAAPFQIQPNPDNEQETYHVLEKALQNQNKEGKTRIKNLSLPSISAYPKLTTGENFIKWKRHFESVCYSNVELLNLLEEGPLVNPIDPPNRDNILFQGSNGINLFYLSESIFRSVDLYCRKINYHIWQALLEAIKDDTTALAYTTSVTYHDYSALWSKLCSRWLATSAIRKAKHLEEFNKLQRYSNEHFKVFYHRMETTMNILQIEFNYEIPEDQIILKVLHAVDDHLQSLFLHLRTSNMDILEICQKLIIAEEQLLLTKKFTSESSKFTSELLLTKKV